MTVCYVTYVADSYFFLHVIVSLVPLLCVFSKKISIKVVLTPLFHSGCMIIQLLPLQNILPFISAHWLVNCSPVVPLQLW